MDEELANLQLDRPARGKSQEELRKHTLDTQFENRPIERSLFLLTKGDDIQKLSVISIVPNLLTIDLQATITRILPKIHQQLASSPCEFHLATSKMYASLMERKVPVNLLHVVVQGIDSRDPIIANAWLDTLVKVIPTLTDAQIKNEVLPLAVYKAGINQPIFYRIASCKIIGKTAVHPKLQPADVKRDILPITQSLCQDCNHEVRAAISAQLSFVAEGLGSMFPKANLLPVLVELAQDENSIVRAASVQAAVYMLPLLTAEIKKSTMFPLIKHLYEKSVEQNDISCVTIAKDFGGILEGLRTCLPVSDSIWFLQSFSALANKGLPAKPGDNQYANASQDVLCRQHCASNLPAVAYYVLTELPGHVDHINTVCHSLTSDPCYIVRRTAAGCIHEVLKILGPLGKALKADIVRLFKDDAEEVLQMVVPHVSSILDLFYSHALISRESTNPSTLDICRGLMKCQVEITKGTNWRLLTKLLYQFEYLPNCVPGDFIHQHFTPSLVNLAVAGRAKPVRSQATRTLLMFLRYNTKEAQKKWLRETLVTNLCYANSCYTRHIYIRMCVHALEIFSSRYFKDYFYAPLLNLGEDKVSNIRLALVNLLPTLKNMLQPEDRKLQMIFENTVRLIETQEHDRDVIAYYQLRAKEANVPLTSAQVQERQNEERRKLEEESVIAAGKWIPILPKTTTSVQQAVIPTVISTAPPLENGHAKTPIPRSSPLSLQRTTSAASSKSPTFTKQSRLSDMSILEQHFYTDAGINLPVSTGNNDQSKAKTIPTTNMLELRPKVALKNATDDAKANLQRINKDVAKLNISKSDSVINESCKIVNRNKRHSIVFPTHDNGQLQKKMLNRRSLSAIPTRETSRIPVSSKGTCKIQRSDSADIVCNSSELNTSHTQIRFTERRQKSNSNKQNAGSNIACFKSSLNSCNKENIQKSSGLPVLMRRALSEPARK